MVGGIVRGGALALLVLAPLAAQGPVKALTRPEAEFAESFDAVQAVRELPGGKLLVTDLGPRTVLLVDFAGGTQTTVGRNGQGPGEYQFPGELLAYRGDTTLLVDRISRRFLPITSSGRIGKSIPFPESVTGLGDPRATDSQGRIYFQGSPFGNPSDGEVSTTVPDSVAVFRWDRAKDRIDTVAVVKIPAMKVQVSGTANARAVMIRPQPFAAADEWGVTGSGLVGIARVADYHVEWVGGSRPVLGQPVRYDRVKVGAAERDEFIRAMQNTRNRITINRGGPGPGAGSNSSTPPAPSADEFDWPDYKPPFPSRQVFMSPEGQLWVVRSRAAGDSTPRVDVFDASGRLASQVTLPRGRRLVALGTGTVYAVRTDDDGLQWLERYRR